MDVPETPEGAALYLLRIIMENGGGGETGGLSSAADVLALFGECLRVAQGEIHEAIRRVLH